MSELVGLSLSFCVKDVLEGRVRPDDVHLIIAGTKARDSEMFALLLEDYKKVYWRKYPEPAAAYATYLYETDRIFQPRLMGGEAPTQNFNWLDQQVPNQWWMKR